MQGDICLSQGLNRVGRSERDDFHATGIASFDTNVSVFKDHAARGLAIQLLCAFEEDFGMRL
ncbi:MAG: hypothetical protein JWO08_2906, partial [Verrucomicrobiaceae bacterium]|nr:hypothetical protein [Verrucomicrobiaceae bacterium]